MLKVLFISNHAGFIKFNAPYMRYLRGNNIEVHNASPGVEINSFYDRQINIPIQRNPLSLRNVKAYNILKKICEMEKYDIIHCHTPTGGIIGRLLGRFLKKKNIRVKIIYTAHGFHFYKGAPLFNWLIYYPIEKCFSYFTDYIVTINEEDYQLAKRKFNKSEVRKINSVGIDLNRFINFNTDIYNEYKKKFGINRNDFVVVYIAQFIKRKNHKMLFDVIPELNREIENIKYILIGDGYLLEKYKKKCKKKSIKNVFFTGYTRYVPEICRLGTIHVSTSKQEGFSLNNIEAMACGLPVVATDIRGHRDLITDYKNGFLIKNKEELKKYVLLLYENRDLLKTISDYNRNIVKNYSIERILPEMAEVYSEVILSLYNNIKYKHINILGTAGVPAQYGGFETLVDNLLNYNEEYNITVFCSSIHNSERIKNYKNAHLKYIPLKANGLSSILYDFFSMLLSLKSDYMLILGVSGALFLPLIRLLYKGKIITNIDGLEWKRNKWNKIIKLYLKFSEKLAVIFSDVIVADNQGIVEYCNVEYKKYKNKIQLIEYGGDHVISNNSKVNIDKKFYEFMGSEYAMAVCRIEPENNIHLILEAFSEISNLKLVIIGNWRNSNYGKELYDKYKARNNIYLLDPIYEQTTLNSIRRNAKIYIHGHSAGGTNPSLVEAMNLGLPVFAFDCIYNRETTENKAKYWRNSEDLKKLLVNNDCNELKLIAENMKLIADKRYKWEIISKKYFDLFD